MRSTRYHPILPGLYYPVSMFIGHCESEIRLPFMSRFFLSPPKMEGNATTHKQCIARRDSPSLGSRTKSGPSTRKGGPCLFRGCGHVCHVVFFVFFILFLAPSVSLPCPCPVHPANNLEYFSLQSSLFSLPWHHPQPPTNTSIETRLCLFVRPKLAKPPIWHLHRLHRCQKLKDSLETLL